MSIRCQLILTVCSRALAESSPYFEALKQKNVEVLFCYEGHDELVLMQLRQFDRYALTSVEKEMRQDKEADDLGDLGKFLIGNFFFVFHIVMFCFKVVALCALL